MGEQPIFTTKAHVFQIDPNTKKKWLPVSTTAIQVSYYYDSTRNTYRIISVDGSKAVINSTITPNMQFTKTSQKFGQWTDPRANTVYGLGFGTELELAKFVEKFKEVKELQRQGSSPLHTNGSVDTSQIIDHVEVTSSPINSPKPVFSSPQHSQVDSNLQLERRNSGSNVTQGSTEAQLKYENDRLKIALAQSSANAKKWEVELQTLKNNNARLTTALQESTSNVEEWKKQLAIYKEESARMKRKVLELEKAAHTGSGPELLQRQLNDSNDRLQDLETSNRQKQEEINKLNMKIDELRPYEIQNLKLQERLQTLDQEVAGLRTTAKDLNQQLETSRALQSRNNSQLGSVHQQLSLKVSEIKMLQDQLGGLLTS